MERRNFIKSSACTTVAGMAAINGLNIKGMFGMPAGSMPRNDLPVPQSNKLVVKPVIRLTS